MLDEIENKATKRAKEARVTAWKNFAAGYKKEQDKLKEIIVKIEDKINLQSYRLQDFIKITLKPLPTRRSYLSFAKGLSLKIHLIKKVENERNTGKVWH